MSIQSLETFEKIIMYLSIMRYIFKSRTKKKLFDLNRAAEPFFQNILNIVYEWDLVNLDKIQSNYPAIDLGDTNNRVCIQITAENTSEKIKNTIEKFIEKDLYKDYDTLIILIITDKKSYTTSFDTKNKFSFSKEDDIKDIDDLLSKIEELSFEKREELQQFLEKELSTIISLFAESNSLLAKVEKEIALPPLNAEKFFSHFQYEDNEKYNEIIKIKDFYQKLKSLPKNTRNLLSFIIKNGSIENINTASPITIHPKKLENLLRTSSKKDVSDELAIIEATGILYEDDDGLIKMSFFMNSGIEFLTALKEFSESENILDEIIVKGDFTKLDGC